jgi:hypothetical protein
MANALYGLARQKFLEGGIPWLTANIKVYLVDVADYTVLIDTHDFADDVATVGKVATSANLTGKTSTLGVANAASPVTFTAVTGDPSEALIIWRDTATQSTSELIAYIDTATGLPVTPNGGDITITWDTGANKIFKL